MVRMESWHKTSLATSSALDSFRLTSTQPAEKLCTLMFSISLVAALPRWDRGGNILRAVVSDGFEMAGIGLDLSPVGKAIQRVLACNSRQQKRSRRGAIMLNVWTVKCLGLSRFTAIAQCMSR